MHKYINLLIKKKNIECNCSQIKSDNKESSRKKKNIPGHISFTNDLLTALRTT